MAAPKTALYNVTSSAPVTGMADVTPDDANDLPLAPARGFMFFGAGDIRVTMADGSVHTLTGLDPSVAHPFAILRVHATGTTASGIKALY